MQLYLRDPAGNLIEVDWPDVRTLGEAVSADLRRLVDVRSQAGHNLRATLFLTKERQRVQ